MQLALMIAVSADSNGQERGVFSEPKSQLLFGGDLGNLVIVTSVGNLIVPRPPGAILESSVPLPALTAAGDKVAASFQLPDDRGSTICHPSWPVSGPYKRPIYRSVLGVFSLHEKTWKLYGDYCFVGSAAFSPEGNEVAFKATIRSDDPRFTGSSFSGGVLILDLKTGQLRPIPDTTSVIGNGQISWSPDGRYLAVGQTRGKGKSPGTIALIQIGSWTQREIAAGTNPSWSPNGDWIAFLANWNKTCMIVHPDGSGSKVELDLQGRSGEWLFYDAIVWSADGENLLLNEEQFDRPQSEVTTLNLANGKATTMSKRGEPIFGLAAEHASMSTLD
jgi:WD40 repeat protein